MNPLILTREDFLLKGVPEAYNPRLSRLNTRSAR